MAENEEYETKEYEDEDVLGFETSPIGKARKEAKGGLTDAVNRGDWF